MMNRRAVFSSLPLLGMLPNQGRAEMVHNSAKLPLIETITNNILFFQPTDFLETLGLNLLFINYIEPQNFMSLEPVSISNLKNAKKYSLNYYTVRSTFPQYPTMKELNEIFDSVISEISLEKMKGDYVVGVPLMKLRNSRIISIYGTHNRETI